MGVARQVSFHFLFMPTITLTFNIYLYFKCLSYINLLGMLRISEKTRVISFFIEAVLLKTQFRDNLEKSILLLNAFYLSKFVDVLEFIHTGSNTFLVNDIKKFSIRPLKQTINKVPTPIGPLKIKAISKNVR
jgi:hypothetical protein